MKKSILFSLMAVIALVTLMSFSACCNGDDVSKKEVKVTSITFGQSSLTLTPGEASTIKTTVSPADATNPTLKWTSSDEGVATVDQSGKVTAVGQGTATITAAATDGSGVKAECEVTVNTIKVSSITMSASTLTLDPKGTEILKATINPENATAQVLKWTSSDEGVATVDQSGKVTAVAPGTAVITAAATDDSGVKAECEVTVNTIKVSSITMSASTLTLEPSGTETLTATVNPSDATEKTVKWTTSNEAVAKVDQNGKVTAVSEGTATITASATDGSGKSSTCTVTVEKKIIKVTSIKLDKSTLTLDPNKTATLKATVEPDNATTKTINWKSSNTDVATVANGVVTTIAPGTAVITAEAADGSGVKAECSVTVNPIKVSSIELNYTSLTLAPTKTSTLIATVKPSDATVKTVKWTSSDTNVATVTDGVVLAVSRGTATITAEATDGSGKKATCTVTVESVNVNTDEGYGTDNIKDWE